MRQGNRIKQLGMMVAVAFLMASVVQASEAARLLTSAKVNVYRDGQLVQVLKENAPLPEGALLKPEGDCGVRLAYMSLVAREGSAFAVRQDDAGVELGVEAGMVYFAATGAAKKTVFKTPAGLIVAQQMIVRAAADGVLKGFLQVEAGKATLGVLEGGDMVVSTAEGERVIHAGEQIVLAQATGQGGAAAGGGSAGAASVTGGEISKGLLASGLVVADAITLGVITEAGNDSPAPTSPASP
ncbi:MAG: hypothetical protein V2L15_09905 [Desulfobacteraceae bacterium]|jgi:hypothetical protein|nr:hypothetical protein [Desulfobacteraceae bacterium]